MRKVYQLVIVSPFLSITFLFNPRSYAAEGLKVGDAEVIPLTKEKEL